VTNTAPRDRDIAMVFQNYALYPHMTVAENMGFALIARVSKEERTSRVLEAAKLLDLEPYLDRKPKALSGGQRQRVAMGRAIVRDPQVFLMDEPLSNLDAKLRVQTRSQISSLTRRLGVTTVYVTHGQTEALRWATASPCSRMACCDSWANRASCTRRPRMRSSRASSAARR
jgi:multiple sugar transport system ATP-binding protein